MDASLDELILCFLAQHNTIVLSTCVGGSPWASPVFYANSGFGLYFLSNPASRHAGNLAVNHRVAGAVYAQHQDWQSIRGLQLEGTAAPVAMTGYPQALAVYLRRFPFVQGFVTGSPGIFKIAGKTVQSRFYHLSPERFVLLDNRFGFADRREFPVPG